MNGSQIVIVHKREVFSPITEKCMISATMPLKNLVIHKKDHEIKAAYQLYFLYQQDFHRSMANNRCQLRAQVIIL